MMDFNKKIANKILSDLKKAKNQNISLEILENNVHLNLGAVDSTFPSYIRDTIEKILSKIEDHREEQYAATLNTPNEGMRDETLAVGDLFDLEISQIEEYIC